MQDVNENMDELFREAADNYMLKEGESSWNEISGRLTSSVAPPVMPAKKNNNTKKYFIIGGFVVLCLLIVMFLNYYAPTNNKRGITTISNQNKDANTRIDKHSLVPGGKPLQENKNVREEDTKNDTVSLHRNTVLISSTTYPGLDHLAYTADIADNRDHPVTNVPPVTDLSTFPAIKDQPVHVSINEQQPPAGLLKEFKYGVYSGLSKDSVEKASTPKLNIHNKRRLYYGMLAGAGFTTVKSQSFSRPGFDLGLITGYQFTPRSSVEISLLYSHKYYYTDGQYFKMDKMNDMPPDMEVMSVKSKTSIFEIPVKFKFNILQNKSIIYAAAGVSSYVLVNEKNDYVTSTNGTMGNMQGNYPTTSGYFAGAINIAAGYEHVIGKNGIIRFEPYITIPTKGIGIGSLPITTSGMHVLLTGASHK